MRKMKLAVPLLLAAVLLLAGCSARIAKPLPPREVPVPQVVEKVAVREAPAPDSEAGELPALTERMVIRRAELSLVVASVKDAVSEVESIAVDNGGYLHQSELWKEDGALHARLVIMVPADKFEATLASLRDIAQDIRSESVSGQDVTEEYVDLSARLETLEATEKELRELLSTVRERSGKAEDILAIYRELTQIRSEIERVKGRMQYLERMTAYSTITVSLMPSALARPVGPASWSPANTAVRAFRALLRALQVILDLAIWVVVPVLAVFVVPVGLVVWLALRFRKGKKQARGV